LCFVIGKLQIIWNIRPRLDHSLPMTNTPSPPTSGRHGQFADVRWQQRRAPLEECGKCVLVVILSYNTASWSIRINQISNLNQYDASLQVPKTDTKSVFFLDEDPLPYFELSCQSLFAYLHRDDSIIRYVFASVKFESRDCSSSRNAKTAYDCKSLMPGIENLF